MALFAKNPDEILGEALQYVVDNTAINATTPGSKFRTLLDVLKQYLGEAYLTFDYNTAVALIYGARGRYLDYIGELFHLQRGQQNNVNVLSTHQNIKFYTTKANFGTINNGSNINIPNGARLWAQRNGQNIYFILSESITLPANVKEYYISANALSSGSISNVNASSIVFHDFTNYFDSANNSLLITNVDTIDSGIDSESDENFRYRILNARLSELSANKTAIFMAALGVNGVADALILDKYFGIGTSGIMIKSTTPIVSDALLARVQVAIDNVKAEGVDIIAIKPKYIALKFIVTPIYHDNVTFNDIVNIKKNITDTIVNYVNNLDIGESFSINELTTIILLNNSQVKSIGKTNKFFDRILSIKILDGGQQIINELINDLSVDQFTKLIISTDSDAVVIK